VSLVIAAAGEKYVYAAYGVFLALVLVYVAIMASKLARIERELHDLTEDK
jgi:CcmD family protein